MSEASTIDRRKLRADVERFLDGSWGAAYVPEVSELPVDAWGTPWARLVVALLEGDARPPAPPES